MLLTKDGITVEHENPADIARLKALGYKEVAPVVVPPEEKSEPKAKTPEELNAEAIAEANKPIGSKKGGKA